MKYLIAAAGLLMSSTGLTAMAEAPQTGELVAPRDAECSATHARGNTKGFFGGETKNGVKEGRGPDTARYYALEAARNALVQGYNYAIMAPLEIKDQVDYNEVVEYGWGVARRKMRRGQEYRVYFLNCRAFDDEDAFRMMWDRDALEEMGENRALVDLREFIKVIGGADNPFAARPRNIAVKETWFRRPGDRERILSQHSVRLAAAQCNETLTPINQSQFKHSPDRVLSASARQCLEGLRAEAQAVGWTDFPLLAADAAGAAASSGYALNTSASSAGSADEGLPVDIWGANWTDLTGKYSGFPGKIMHKEKELLLMSNTLSDRELMDYAVFEGATLQLQRSYSGFSLRDVTPDARKQFTYAMRTNSGKADKAKNNAARDVTRAQEQVDSGRRNVETEERDYAANPTPHRKDMLELEIRQLKKAEAELAEAVAALKAVESQFSDSDMRPSSGKGPAHELKAPFRAFEDYTTVLLLNVSDVYGGQCGEAYIVCADKLQAYNALGEKLGVAGFAPLSAPTDYKTWVRQ